MSNNQAAWLDGKEQKLRVDKAEYPKPESDDIVVRNYAVAVNPVDSVEKIQDSGYFIKQWPTVLGCDIAGEVVEVGDGVKRFKRGDRVAGHTISLASQNPFDGGFQLYSRVKAAKSAILPKSITYAVGSVIPLALDTAAVGLYSDSAINLPLPSLDSKPSGKILVVWGGSSSVGALTIQLAVASGAKVIAVASSHNHEFVKSAGAEQAFDYKSSSIVDDVVKAVKDSGDEFVGVYDAISLPDQSLKYTIPITEKLGGGLLATVLPPPENVPSSVKPAYVFAINDLTHKIWEEYVTPALEQGKLKAIPEPFIVGKGLEAVQKGLDENKKGVSAKKVVIELERAG